MVLKKIIALALFFALFACFANASLVSWWKFDESSGTTATDSADSNPGTLTNGPTHVSGILNNAVNFDGSNDFVQVIDAANLDLSTQGSVTAWIFANTLSSNSGIVHKGSLSNRSNEAYSLEADPSGNKILFKICSGSGNCTTSSSVTSIGTVSTGQWHFIAGTWNSSSIKVYINGALDNTASNSLSVRNTSGNLLIGSRATNAGRFTGKIDEAHIYNHALSLSEVQALYCIDNDGDGYSSTSNSGVCGTLDCNDNNSSIHPGAAETCNNADDNCNGSIDEGGVCYTPGCGNGIIDAGEQCDLGDLNSQTCTTQGFLYGSLSCNANCTLNTGSCTNQQCGNSLVEGTEVCDLSNLNSQTCIGLGFTSGSLACSPACTAFDTTGCYLASCNNGTIDSGEVCDSGNLNLKTCITQGFADGNLSCGSNCTFFNTTQCITAPLLGCGNGICDSGEDGCNCFSDCLQGCSSCGDGTCQSWENCGTCSSDCSGNARQVCCNSKLEEGNCCSDNSCNPFETCRDFSCYQEALRVLLLKPANSETIQRGLLRISAEAYYDSKKTSNASVFAESEAFGKVQLLDDGLHDDGKALDGVYANSVQLNKTSIGLQSIALTALQNQRFDKKLYTIVISQEIALDFEIGNEYSNGDLMQIKGGLKDLNGNSVPKAVLEARLSSGEYSIGFFKGINNGIFEIDYLIPYGLPAGEWTLSLNAIDDSGNQGTNYKKFALNDNFGELKVQILSIEKDRVFKPGERIEITAKVLENGIEKKGAKAFALMPDEERIELTETEGGIYSTSALLKANAYFGKEIISAFAELQEDGLLKKGGGLVEFIVEKPVLEIMLVGLKDKYDFENKRQEFTARVSAENRPVDSAFVSINGYAAVQKTPGNYSAIVDFAGVGVQDINIIVKEPKIGESEKKYGILVGYFSLAEKIPENAWVIGILAITAIAIYFISPFRNAGVKLSKKKEINLQIKKLQEKYYKDKSINRKEYEKFLKELNQKKQKIE